jgi:hypothetical protein
VFYGKICARPISCASSSKTPSELSEKFFRL